MKKLTWLIAIIAIIFVAGLAFGKSNIGLRGIGLEVGFVKPSSIASTLGFGARADLGTIMPKLELDGELLYWKKSYTESYWDWSYSQFYITALAKYFFQKKSSKWNPYVGGGLGLVMGSSKSSYKGPSVYDYGYYGSTSVSATNLGIHLLAGIKGNLSPTLDGFAEVRYCTDGVDFLGIFAGAIYKMK